MFHTPTWLRSRQNRFRVIAASMTLGMSISCILAILQITNELQIGDPLDNTEDWLVAKGCVASRQMEANRYCTGGALADGCSTYDLQCTDLTDEIREAFCQRLRIACREIENTTFGANIFSLMAFLFLNIYCINKFIINMPPLHENQFELMEGVGESVVSSDDSDQETPAPDSGGDRPKH